MYKICFKCKKRKQLNLFYLHKQMADGHLNKCIKCTKKDVKNRYNNPESRKKINEYEKKRFNNPERKRKVLLYQQKRRLRFPGKDRARQKFSRAVKEGRIKRLPCEICGNIKSEGHHTDYRKYLDVKWLCFKHHREEHNK